MAANSTPAPTVQPTWVASSAETGAKPARSRRCCAPRPNLPSGRAGRHRRRSRYRPRSEPAQSMVEVSAAETPGWVTVSVMSAQAMSPTTPSTMPLSSVKLTPALTPSSQPAGSRKRKAGRRSRRRSSSRPAIATEHADKGAIPVAAGLDHAGLDRGVDDEIGCRSRGNGQRRGACRQDKAQSCSLEPTAKNNQYAIPMA